jgi:hypothetical protein
LAGGSGKCLQGETAMEIKMPRRPRDVALAVASCVLVLVALVAAAVELRHPRYSNLEYFTVDDGQTWVALPAPHFAPFDYQGKTAVQAMLFTGSNGKPFVGYLMKYTPAAQRALSAASDTNASTTAPLHDTIRSEDRLYKRPGQGEWVPGNDPAAAEIWGAVVDPKTKARAQHWH